MKGKIEYIDFAKGYAIFTIVLYHAMQRVPLSPLLQKAIIFGGTGVHLFFLLSGFGLGLSKANLSPGNFYKRRLTKIWLPYVLVLTISLLAALSIKIFDDGLDAWAAGVFLYQMFSGEYIASFGGHFWFISAIVQFYLVFPVLIWAKNKIGNAWLFFALSMLVSIVWWEAVFLLGKGGERVWNSFFLQFLWEFSLGLTLADVFKNADFKASDFVILKNFRNLSVLRGDFWNFKWWAYLPVGLFFTGLMILMILKMGDIGKIFNDIPALIGYASLSIFLYHVGDKFIPPVKRFFLWVGGFSYSLYLVHVLVLEIYLSFFAVKGLPVSLPLLLPFVPLALAVGWAFEPVSQWFVGLFDGKKISSPEIQKV